MQKLLNRFSENLLKRWHMGHGENRQTLVVIGITLRWGYVRVTVSLGFGLSGQVNIILGRIESYPVTSVSPGMSRPRCFTGRLFNSKN